MLDTFKLFKLERWPDPPPAIPDTVRHLELMACPGLRSLRDISHLTRLRVLRLGVCADLAHVSLRPFAHLEELSLVDVGVRALDDLNRAPRLHTAYFRDLPALATITADGEEQQVLRQLSLGECPALHTIDGLAHLTGLERVAFEDLPRLTSVRALMGLRKLRELAIIGCPGIVGIAPLVRLPALARVTISRCPGIRDLELWGARADVEVTVT